MEKKVMKSKVRSSYKVIYSNSQAYISVEENKNPDLKKIPVAVFTHKMVRSLIEDKKNALNWDENTIVFEKEMA